MTHRCRRPLASSVRRLAAVTISPSGRVIEESIIGGLRSKAYFREGNWAVLVQKESYAE
jgi:hypothetical protein